MYISWRQIFAATAALGVLAGISVCSRALAAAPDNVALDKFAAIWTSLRTYTCTVKVHEANGAHVQDRVIHISFAKPHDTRVDIVAGDVVAALSYGAEGIGYAATPADCFQPSKWTSTYAIHV